MLGCMVAPQSLMLLTALIVQYALARLSSHAWIASTARFALAILHPFIIKHGDTTGTMPASCLPRFTEEAAYTHEAPPPRLRPVRKMRSVSMRRFSLAYLIIESIK